MMNQQLILSQLKVTNVKLTRLVAALRLQTSLCLRSFQPALFNLWLPNDMLLPKSDPVYGANTHSININSTPTNVAFFCSKPYFGTKVIVVVRGARHDPLSIFAMGDLLKRRARIVTEKNLKI
jgi:hypothetical protein